MNAELNSTQRQTLAYASRGYEPPRYAHPFWQMAIVQFAMAWLFGLFALTMFVTTDAHESLTGIDGNHTSFGSTELMFVLIISSGCAVLCLPVFYLLLRQCHLARSVATLSIFVFAELYIVTPIAPLVSIVGSVFAFAFAAVIAGIHFGNPTIRFEVIAEQKDRPRTPESRPLW